MGRYQVIRRNPAVAFSGSEDIEERPTTFPGGENDPDTLKGGPVPVCNSEKMRLLMYPTLYCVIVKECLWIHQERSNDINGR
mmetsp:Transcript_4022/g.4992  ORF Transcript_4022/g.4992 Transcript_4022/m.4992 type:complete len:82 (-) Transcript_4022:123-368(-)